MKPKYNLELFYVAVFLSSEDWIHSLKALTDVQGFVWFTDRSGTK
jgi:hypothetical protein